MALAAYRGRGRGRNNADRGRRGRGPRSSQPRTDKSSARTTVCQICMKTGHSAIKCWYRADFSYNEDSQKTALFGSSEMPNHADWYLDSGASTHLTADPNHLSTTDPYTGSAQVVLGNGQKIPIQHTGKGILPTPSGKLILQNIHHVPNLSFNLLSVHQLTHDNNCIVSFSSNGYQIKDMKSNRLLLHGPCHNGLYSIRSTKPPDLALLSIQTVPNLWHSRLGHPAAATLNRLSVSNSHIHNKSHSHLCTTCQLAKSKQLSFPTSVTTTTRLFELVHSDVWGNSHTTSIQGYHYFVTFIDDYSRFCWVFPLTQKSEVFHVFCKFS
ncbi:Retrovirus-related Pol polyprotein from transposon TNT 1-94 [Dendrobium catenatum]|uniref:Retrovirus-related Pol polyprotein from transposon TNT 1-94 n=1 Tax=Dendrobium catenatum TaxID=906689 RepID=A0A2I0V9V8_9ASPA|nr:Retrovirus-related Pol polyprotein from transposon TNT 1-94 [Dendrobium catenatum]